MAGLPSAPEGIVVKSEWIESMVAKIVPDTVTRGRSRGWG